MTNSKLLYIIDWGIINKNLARWLPARCGLSVVGTHRQVYCTRGARSSQETWRIAFSKFCLAYQLDSLLAIHLSQVEPLSHHPLRFLLVNDNGADKTIVPTYSSWSCSCAAIYYVV